MMKKKLKGFTLVEIIVALAVFSIMSLVVVMIIQMSASIMKDSQYTTKKADTQSIIAQSKSFSSTTDRSTVGVTKITINDVTLNFVQTVEIEGKKNRDSDLDDNNFYEDAPNTKVFTSSGTKTY